jgi:hypothetical protein
MRTDEFAICMLVLQIQCQDVLNVISEMYGREPPAIILIGHRLAILLHLYLLGVAPTLGSLHFRN